MVEMESAKAMSMPWTEMDSLVQFGTIIVIQIRLLISLMLLAGKKNKIVFNFEAHLFWTIGNLDLSLEIIVLTVTLEMLKKIFMLWGLPVGMHVLEMKSTYSNVLMRLVILVIYIVTLLVLNVFNIIIASFYSIYFKLDNQSNYNYVKL